MKKKFQQDDFGLCVAAGQDPLDPASELDPDRECDLFDTDGNFQRFTAIAPCKNNCPGGEEC